MENGHALLLLLVPLRDIYETLSNQRLKDSERIRRNGWEYDWKLTAQIWKDHHKDDDFSLIEDFIKKNGVANIDAQGETLRLRSRN